MTNAELNLAVLDGLRLDDGSHESWEMGACLGLDAVHYGAEPGQGR